MTRRLRMSAELGDWLAELCAFHPASAADVAAALTSVMTADDPSTHPLIRQPADSLDPRQAVDYDYQEQLEALQRVRRHVADIATDRKHWVTAVDEAKSAGRPDEVLAQLRLRQAEAAQREQELTERSQRLQRDVDAFRIAKEVAKAMYTAAEASLRLRETFTDEIAADDIAADEISADGAAAEARLQAAADELRRLHEPRRTPATADILELHADALGRDVRLLLAIEPADTVTVLAVLDGEDAIDEHRYQAIQLAGDLLTDIRAGDWPPADALDAADLEVTFADSATFLARFFPADAGAIAERADALGVAQTLAGLRSGNGMSLADLVTETGVNEERLRGIEARGLRVAEVHEAVAYVRALGGRLTLTAEMADATAVPLT
jgi:phage shock protein A